MGEGVCTFSIVPLWSCTFCEFVCFSNGIQLIANSYKENLISVLDLNYKLLTSCCIDFVFQRPRVAFLALCCVNYESKQL